MESVPLFVFPMWGAAVVTLIVSLAILRAAPPTPEPAGVRAFLLPFAIPVAVVSVIVLIVSGIGTLLLVVRETVEHATGYVPEHGAGVSPGAGAAIAVALAFALIVLLGCAYLAARPSHQHR